MHVYACVCVYTYICILHYNIYTYLNDTHMDVTSRDDLHWSRFRCGMLCCRRVRACMCDRHRCYIHTRQGRIDLGVMYCYTWSHATVSKWNCGIRYVVYRGYK